MSLRQKLYRAYLTEFKEEVCRNPNADFTPRIQGLAAKFGSHEKNFVDELFLTLYDGDAHSLKMDLCALGTAKPAEKAGPSERKALLQCLYKTLSPYIEPNFSTIIAVCNQGIGLDPETYETLLLKFKEEVRRDPNADFAPYIKELADEIINREKTCGERVVNTLFWNLYQQNDPSLELDLTKLLMLKPTKKAAPPERITLLQCLCGALSSYIQEDFSDLIAMCDSRLNGGA